VEEKLLWLSPKVNWSLAAGNKYSGEFYGGRSKRFLIKVLEE
jgi:hypothetical protein